MGATEGAAIGADVEVGAFPPGRGRGPMAGAAAADAGAGLEEEVTRLWDFEAVGAELLEGVEADGAGGERGFAGAEGKDFCP